MEAFKWEDMDIDTIKSKYDLEQQQLKTALLHGVCWEDVREKQQTVSQLSILLYHRISQHPAEHTDRRR